jgi:hypothetical protein
MTVIGEIRTSGLAAWKIVLLVAAGGSFLFCVGMVVTALVAAPSMEERKLCDEMVSTVLTTTDPLELQRAMFLIRRLDCSIRRRL